MRTFLNNIKNKLKNEKGMSMVSGIGLLTLVGLMSVSVLEVSNADMSATTNNLNQGRAFYVANAGLEWAKYNILNGNDPTVLNKKINITDPKQGTFTVALDSSTNTVDVIGKVMDSRSNQKTTLMASDCISIGDTYDMNFGPYPAAVGYSYGYGAIYAVKLINKCPDALGSFTLTHIKIKDLIPLQNIIQIIMGGSDIFNRYGQNYFYFPPTATALIGTAISNKYIITNSPLILGGATTTIDEIYVNYTNAAGMPIRGSTNWEVEFTFSDGSSLTKTFSF